MGNREGVRIAVVGVVLCAVIVLVGSAGLASAMSPQTDDRDDGVTGTSVGDEHRAASESTDAAKPTGAVTDGAGPDGKKGSGTTNTNDEKATDESKGGDEADGNDEHGPDERTENDEKGDDERDERDEHRHDDHDERDERDEHRHDEKRDDERDEQNEKGDDESDGHDENLKHDDEIVTDSQADTRTHDDRRAPTSSNASGNASVGTEQPTGSEAPTAEWFSTSGGVEYVSNDAQDNGTSPPPSRESATGRPVAPVPATTNQTGTPHLLTSPPVKGFGRTAQGTAERGSASSGPDTTTSLLSGAVLLLFATGVNGVLTASLNGILLAGLHGMTMGAGTVFARPRLGSHSTRRRTERTFRRAKQKGWLRKLWLLFGYSRFDDSDPLENDARRAIYEAVEESPGAYYTRVAEETEVPLSTVRYHCRILVHEGLVEESNIMGKRRLYPVGSGQHELAAALEDDVTATMLTAVARLEPATGSTLAAELDRAPSTVSYHLKRLADQDLVVREREGCSVTTRLAPDVRSALAVENTGLREIVTAEQEVIRS